MLGKPVILKRLKKNLWRGIKAMNYTDTTHYLFPVESKPGVVNVLPWLDEMATTNTSTGAENIDQNNAQTNSDALSNSGDYSKNPSAALMELQRDFVKFDSDKSESLSFEELTAASTESAAAKWALSRYRPLTQVASETSSGDGIESSEDIVARMQASRHVPIELSSQLFKDSIPSMLGVSKQDLKTSLDFTDSKAVSSLLEGSATSEKKSGTGYLVSGLVAGGAVYPLYKLCSKVNPWVGAIGGVVAGLTSVIQFSHFNARRNAKDTAQLEEQINKTRQMLGLESIAPVTTSEKPEQEKQIEDKQTDEDKNASEEDLLNQSLQKTTG
jgi:hypothetical protein